MKTISIVVPTYNEEKNIFTVYERVNKVFREELPNYKCNLQFIDNCSTDKTRNLIRELCSKDKNVTAIFNAKNFGFVRSQFYGIAQAQGDAVVELNADLQDPPEVIPQFVKEWEDGAKVVCGIKNKSRENPIMYLCRKIYYKFIKKIAEIDHIEQFDGFGLYDKSFIEVIRNLDDNLPYLRGIVAEFGANRSEIFYSQEKRKEGKSHFKFLALYDLAMLGITSYTKVIMHLCTLMGGIIAFLCTCVSIFAFIQKLIHWNTYPFGTATLQVGIFLLGAIQLIFIGFVGEYIVNINTRTMHHPIVIEQERINF